MIVVSITGFGTAVAVGPSADAAIPSDAFSLQNVATGQCLDDSSAAGLRTYPCNSASFYGGYQAWEAQPYMDALRNVVTGLCVDDSAQYGLRGFPCTAASYSNGYQNWEDSLSSPGQLQNLNTGLCLDDSSQYGLRGFPCVPASYTNGYQHWVMRNGPAPASPTSPTTTSAPPASPPSPTPVTTTPVATPLPVPKKPHELAVRVVFDWNWSRAVTRLDAVHISSYPGRLQVFVRCSGPRCPAKRDISARGARNVRRLLRALRGTHYRAGDKLRLTLKAPGYLPERALVKIRNGREPRIRLLSD